MLQKAEEGIRGQASALHPGSAGALACLRPQTVALCSMVALCDYEVEREQRVAENKRRMDEMGLLKVHGPTMHSSRARSLVLVSGIPVVARNAYRIALSYSTGTDGACRARLQSLMHWHCALKQP